MYGVREETAECGNVDPAPMGEASQAARETVKASAPA